MEICSVCGEPLKTHTYDHLRKVCNPKRDAIIKRERAVARRTAKVAGDFCRFIFKQRKYWREHDPEILNWADLLDDARKGM